MLIDDAYFEARRVERIPSCLSAVMRMIVSGAEGLPGYGDLIMANAFEARIDNAINAITKDLVVFMATI
jgi:hypothetical protein